MHLGDLSSSDHDARDQGFSVGAWFFLVMLITVVSAALGAPAPDADGLPADPVEKFVPAQPLSDEEAARLDAMKLFVIGVGQLDRNENAAAYRTFEKALESDPKNLAVLKEIAPLAFELNRVDEGVAFCRRALELEPDNYRLLHLLAGREAQAGRIEEAITALQKAIESPEWSKQDPRAYFQILSDLVQHLSAVNRPADMVGPLRRLVEMAANPDRFHLGEFGRRQLDRRKILDLEQLGKSLAKLDRIDEAIELLNKAREKDARGKRLALALAEIHFEKGNIEEANKELDAYLGLGTQNREAYELLEKILARESRSEDLLPRLAKLVEADADNPVLREFYAQKLIDGGKLEEAQQELNRLRGRAAALDLQARLYLKSNDPEKLLATLAESIRTRQVSPNLTEQVDAFSKHPDLLEKMAESARQLPNNDPNAFYACYILGEIASKATKPDLAIEFFNRAIDARDSIPQVHMQLLDVLWESKRFEELLAACERAEKSNPAQRSLFLEYHSRALDGLGRTEESVKLIEDFVKQSTNSEEVIAARLALARIHLQSEQFDKAIEVCRGVLADFPQNEQSHFAKYLLATILSQKGEHDEAERMMLELLENPSALSAGLAATINNDLGYTWADQGKNLDRAEIMIRKALEARPNEPAYLDSLGWVLFKKESYEEAAKLLKQATDQPAGQDAVIFDHLGDVYLKLKNSDEALKSWNKALELMTEVRTEKQKKQLEEIKKKIQFLATPETK